MNYEDMSDFEINSAVAKAAGLEDVMFFEVDREICGGPVWNRASGKHIQYQALKGCAFDPCNNPSDAWPIIVGNDIGFEKFFDFCCSECGEYYDTGRWEASNPDFNRTSRDKNPLRAAMEVFLMMKEGEKKGG